MPRVVQPKRKQAAKLPIGRMHPDPSTRYHLKVYIPGGERFERSYSTPEMRIRWKKLYKERGYRTRII